MSYNCMLCKNVLTEQEFKDLLPNYKAMIDDEVEKSEIVLQDKFNKSKIALQDDFNKSKIELKDELERKIKTETEELINGLKSAIVQKDTETKNVQATLKLLYDKIATLEAEVKTKSPNILGDIGEKKLIDILRENFPEDSYITERKGQEEADIIQTIMHKGTKLEPVICYDSKLNKMTFSSSWIDKCVQYQKIHNTRWVFLVADNLPSPKTGNVVLQEQDGVIIIHPYIIGPVIRYVRQFIMEINKMNLSEIDRTEKSEKLYEFIISSDCQSILSSIYLNLRKINEQLSEEGKKHQKWWNERAQYYKEVFEQLDVLRNSLERSGGFQFTNLIND